MILFYDTNQRNAQFSKLIFNFSFLVRVSKLFVSSSGSQLYMQYDMLYMHWCEQYGGQEGVFETLLSLLHVSLHLYHPQGFPKLHFVKVTYLHVIKISLKITKLKYVCGCC